jgi:hypothetical protein
MLRLTLRTLLAYLDDTLEPAQAKDIGKKVAESDIAQETVERIKTVTRRRRLSAPPLIADDHSTDPNSIAEYLDNVLPTDDVAELEQSALDNDTRLAEIAACHQILTLVLGEPAKVPPTARRRMYRLVSGPESIPYRQPAAAGAPVAGVAAPAEVDEYQDHDDDLLGSFLGPRKILWLVSLLIAVGLLCLAIALAIPSPQTQPNQGYIAVAARPEPIVLPAISPKKPEPIPEKKPDVPELEPLPALPDIGPVPRVVGEAPAPVRAPDSERRAIAKFDSPMQPLLLQRRDTPRWERPDANDGRLPSTDQLLGLPGFHPEIITDTGVRLQLWGNVAELLPAPIAESRITLYVPPQGIDADLTLHGGRVYITVPKAKRPMIVRLRFRDEVWDVTLATPDTEIGIDLIGEPAKGPLFDRDLIESPRALVYLGLLQGVASIRSGFQQSGDLLGGAKWKWDSKGGRAGPAPKDDKDEAGIANRWSKLGPKTPAENDMAAAVTEMARRVAASGGPFDIDFDATHKDPREAPNRRVLSVWMLEAVDGLGYLIDALESDTAAVRATAAKALQHWVAQDPNREAIYTQMLANKAAFSDNQRALMATLVRGVDRPVAAEVIDLLFDYLLYEKLAIRELARMQLAKIDPVGAKESNYDAASERRGGQKEMWKTSWKKRNK